MRTLDRVTEEQLEFMKRMYLNQGRPIEQRYPYPDPRTMCAQEPSREERARVYKNSTRKIFVLGWIASVVLAAAVPLKDISFFSFAVILLASRAADILSTLLCLQMPWVYEANPNCDARRLSPEFLSQHIFRILSVIGFTCLLDQFCPLLARVILLAYAMSSFVVSISNLNQTFCMRKSSMGFYLFCNAALGAGALFLFRSLLQAH